VVNRRDVIAVLVGGLIAGTLDMTFAVTFAAYGGTAPMRVLQSVASGLFGREAFSGGDAMAALGLGLHFVMSLLWACVFLAVATLRPSLVRRPIVAGLVFGVVVFLVMRLVVVPLSACPCPMSFKPLATVLDLLSHMLLFGVPIAVAVRRASR
jgi:uncharacterized membrane protein YagU involved in acid resistance